MILIVDNYDSFTYNLVQLISSRGEKVEVVRNDVETAADLLARGPAGIVISPGPGRPEDAGVCVELVRSEPTVPILGVCLGQQALAVAFGGIVRRAGRLMHGKTSQVQHDGGGIFAGLANPFDAARYHSLEVDSDALPDVLEPVAWSLDRHGKRSLQAIRHRLRPYWGVQFHPESILTVDGPRLMENFLALT